MASRVQDIEQSTPLQRSIIRILNDNPRATYKTVAAKCGSTPGYVSDIARRFRLDRWGVKNVALDVDDLVELYTDDQFVDVANLKPGTTAYDTALDAASDIRTDPVTLDQLCRCGIEEIQLAVVQNLGAPQSAVDYLAEHPDSEIAAYAVMDVSDEKLEQYVGHPSPAIRLSVLLHHNRTQEMAESALKDPDQEVRSLAENILQTSR